MIFYESNIAVDCADPQSTNSFDKIFNVKQYIKFNQK